MRCENIEKRERERVVFFKCSLTRRVKPAAAVCCENNDTSSGSDLGADGCGCWKLNRDREPVRVSVQFIVLYSFWYRTMEVNLINESNELEKRAIAISKRTGRRRQNYGILWPNVHTRLSIPKLRLGHLQRMKFFNFHPSDSSRVSKG